MKKPSEIFEGENSSLRKSYDNTMEQMECYTTQNHLKECENCGKYWGEIEKQFDNNFNFEAIFGKDSSARKSILAFFKPYFQEKMHDLSVSELEAVDNSK